MAAEVLISATWSITTGWPLAADLVADGGLDLQLAARLQAERDIVAHGAGDPAVLGHARHRGEAHAGDAAHDIEHGRNHIDPRNRSNVPLQIDHMRGLP